MMDLEWTSGRQWVLMDLSNFLWRSWLIRSGIIFPFWLIFPESCLIWWEEWTALRFQWTHWYYNCRLCELSLCVCMLRGRIPGLVRVHKCSLLDKTQSIEKALTWTAVTMDRNPWRIVDSPAPVSVEMTVKAWYSESSLIWVYAMWKLCFLLVFPKPGECGFIVHDKNDI